MLEVLPVDLIVLLSTYLDFQQALQLRLVCSAITARLSLQRIWASRRSPRCTGDFVWFESKSYGRYRKVKSIGLNFDANVFVLAIDDEDYGCGQCNWGELSEVCGTLVALGRSRFRLECQKKSILKREGGNGFGSAQMYALGSQNGVMGLFYDKYTFVQQHVRDVFFCLMEGEQLVLECVPGELKRLDKCSPPSTQNAIVPFGITKASIFSWATVALFIKSFF